MNAHAIGIIMKEVTRRAMESVWHNRAQFEAEEKISSYKREQDFVTTADFEAQRIYEKSLKECFPTFGIIGEESGLRVECTESDVDIWFSVDPLDGTKAYIRKQSQGVGSMLGLVYDDAIIAAVVGDVMTHEIYYFRPESPNVFRLNLRDDKYEHLRIDPKLSLGSQYVLLREDPRLHSPTIQMMAQGKANGGLFKNIEVAGGSIGTHMARLWKSVVGAVILQAGKQTPWDLVPILGISERLGFIWIEISPNKEGWSVQNIIPSKEITSTKKEILIIHRSRLDEFSTWFNR
jgi:fructose-1,6-bisphosphatase/inositol monophosphatase family enzyme